MSDHALNQRQSKIQTRRRSTSWREFVMEIASRRPITFSKIDDRVSRYPDTDRVAHLMSSEEYEALRDGLTDHGMEIDSTKGFFEQFGELFVAMPKDACFQMGAGENTDYADVVRGSKNVYLSNFIVVGCENVCYSMVTREHCANLFNSLMVFKNCENIYQSAGVIESFNIFYSRYIKNCSDIRFSKNLIGCTHCIACSGLENQSYCINNKQLTKEDYLSKKDALLRQKHKFETLPQQMRGTGTHFGSTDVEGSFVVDSADVKQSSFSYNLSQSDKVMFGGGEFGDEHFVDVFIGGAGQGSHIYGVHGTANTEHIYCSTLVVQSSHVFYSFGLDNCSYCLGCVGLKNKSYCIFNKQYTKEERHQKVDEIFGKMEADGTLGQFFPGWMNPFYFNDTAAYLIDDTFTKEEVTAAGYLRLDDEVKVDIPDRMDVVEVSDIDQYEGYDDDGNWMIDPSILKKVIRDEQGNVYRIIKMEYDFLIKYGLPLPRQHWLDRLKDHFRVS